jgi:acetolactate synthase-1/2/3 large subunit
MSIASPRSGGQILIDQLVVQGVGHVYCVPGESYLAALDALHDSAIEVVVCRQEAGAAMAALTVGRLTGRLEYASLRAGGARPTRHMASISPNMIQRR